MKCFVIMPFGSVEKDVDSVIKLNTIYEKFIKPTVESIEVNGEKIICHRADKEYHSGEIIVHIIEHLINSEIVIADLSGKNPNVFYELGVRHSIKGNTILISENINDIPFDLHSMRIIPYKYTPDQMIEFNDKLKKTLLNIIDNPKDIDNPVRRYMYNLEIEKIKNNYNSLGIDTFKNIIDEIVSLKKCIIQQQSDTQQIIKSIINEGFSNNSMYNLKFFEGCWITKKNNSHYYPVVYKNKLYIPYCFADNDYLNSHYYNCKLMDNLLVAEFKWFDSDISGYTYLKIIDHNKLEGGWVRKEDVSRSSISFDMFQLDEVRNKTIKVEWERVSSYSLPNWAEEYFNNLKRGNIEI